MIPILFEYPTVILVLFILIACVTLLILSSKHVTLMIRGILLFLIVVCVVYFLFLLWIILGFGQGPSHPPVPIQPS